MATRKIATLFGGSGFIGRYLVRHLAAQGYVVRIAGRDPIAEAQLKPFGAVGQIVPLYAPVSRPDDIARAVEEASVVVNLVGILSESRAGDFHRVHALGAGAIAAAAAAAGASTVLQVSAIGASSASDSLYARSKAEGEAAVLAAFPAATILRPSLVFGPEDQFFNRFATMAAWLPVLPVIHGDTKFQPVYVGDVAAAMLAAIDRPDAAGATYELGGPAVFSFRELLDWIRTTTHRTPTLLTIPDWVARIQAVIAERMPGKPFTTDQLRLLAHDNICNPAMPGLAALGVLPTPVQMVVPQYLVRFRPGGAKKPVLATGK